MRSTQVTTEIELWQLAADLGVHVHANVRLMFEDAVSYGAVPEKELLEALAAAVGNGHADGRRCFHEEEFLDVVHAVYTAHSGADGLLIGSRLAIPVSACQDWEERVRRDRDTRVRLLVQDVHSGTAAEFDEGARQRLREYLCRQPYGYCEECATAVADRFVVIGSFRESI